jgi:ABC-type branched-subunit amino acid transport system substrate-binding protein
MVLAPRFWLTIILLFCSFSLSSCQKVDWVTIGVLEDQSGTFKSISQNLTNGRALALSEEGESAGKSWKIKIKYNDTMNLPERTANLMREINEEVDVFMSELGRMRSGS